MRTSSNPAFRNLPTGSNAAHGQYGAPPVGFNEPYGGTPDHGAPKAPGAGDERPMTVDDVVIKTGISLAITVVVALAVGIWAQSQVAAQSVGAVFGIGAAGLIVGLVLGLVITFRAAKGKVSAPLTLLYAAAEGVFLGAVTGVFELLYPGIALQAVLGSAAVFITMLVVYKTGAVKVTPKLTKWVVGVLGGAMLLVLANLVLSFFMPGGFGLFSGGPLTVILALVVIGAAAFAFLLDFDEADHLIRAGMPAKFGWYVAFGLIATLVLLYYYMLILLSSLQGD